VEQFYNSRKASVASWNSFTI